MGSAPARSDAMVPPAWLDEVEALATLGGVLRWAFARTPPAEVVASIAQDEFTVDVVLRAGPGAFLAFDAT